MEHKKFKSIWLSDIHLGTKGCQAERLLDFLYNHSCEELYLVGDNMGISFSQWIMDLFVYLGIIYIIVVIIIGTYLTYSYYKNKNNQKEDKEKDEQHGGEKRR
jgi:UDP-2,3-diacylglucosamine pyrophosphatase LpxH